MEQDDMKRITICLALAVTFASLALVCGTSTGQDKGRGKGKGRTPTTQPADKPTSYYEKRQLRGWTLRINKDLLEESNAKLLSEVLAEMDDHFYRIERTVPAAAVTHLKKVVIWLELDNPKGRTCHYHPSADWLKDNNYNPDKVKCVEIGTARGFLSAVKHQPCVMLHELSHAYHDQVLDFENPKIMACYEAAKKSGTYDKVLIWNGQVGKHYAMTDQKEYFAEDTEAYFGTNDIYPFVRAELKQHDPNMYAALEDAWGVKH
jgi:hypothetical protein